ncbi:MAG: alpha-galactosidase [Prolixibacteraceae bacterium]
MTKSTRLFFLLCFISIIVRAQPFYNINGNEITLNNGLVSLNLNLNNNQVVSSGLIIDADTFLVESENFSFQMNDGFVNGRSGWKLSGVEPITLANQGSGVCIKLKSTQKNTPLRVRLNYILYPDLPLIRKWIEIKNEGKDDIKIESLNVASWATLFDVTHTHVYHNYARMKHIGRFVGSYDDALVVIHDIRQSRGIAIGNETIGVLKRTAFHTEGHRQNIEVGLTTPQEDFPFRKWIKPGEQFETPKIFVCAYNNRDDGFEVVNEEVNRFIIQHMKPRIIGLKEKPTFVYNTWYPFRTFVNDTLMAEVTDAAADCGLEEIIIDDGWQINFKGETSKKDWGGNYGDWLVDEYKFKGGLKPTFDYIKEKGMKPGLWLSIASATGDSRVFKEHPEWFVQKSDGTPGNLHYDGEGDFYSASFGTDWYNYIRNVLINLIDEHGLRYAKLDLAVVTSPYVNRDIISGSYAKDHPYYRDQQESYYVLYNRLLELFDEMHEHSPALFIDCTFETAGKFQLMDYAIAQHAEGNWLSNFEEAAPLGPLRVRQMAWWRSPAMPAASLVIGNLPMDDPNFELGLKSLIGTLPIVLGDPRELSKEKRAEIKGWSDWIKEMQQKYDYMSYRKDLAGFGEPREGYWDGWQRINFQTKEGGIFGVFRQGALEASRTVFLKDLDPSSEYQIKLAPTNKLIVEASGDELMKKGFKVEIKELYDGNIFEIGIK